VVGATTGAGHGKGDTRKLAVVFRTTIVDLLTSLQASVYEENRLG